jgi:hypothetical protein
LPVLEGTLAWDEPGDPEGEKACFKLVEFPGVLMKSRVSMASCSLSSFWGEKRIGSTGWDLDWYVLMRCGCTGVCGDADAECEWERRVGVYRGLELRRGLERGAPIEVEGWIGAGGARAGLAVKRFGGELDLGRGERALLAK